MRMKSCLGDAEAVWQTWMKTVNKNSAISGMFYVTYT